MAREQILPRQEYPDQFRNVELIIPTPAQVQAIFLANDGWVVDSAHVRFGTKSSVSGLTGWLQKGSDGNLIAQAVTITAAVWDNTAKTLTKTGAFTGYTWRSGDRINLTSSSATGFTAGIYAVASKTSNDAVVLTNIDGSAISWTGTLNDVVGIFNPGVPFTGNGVDFNTYPATAPAGVAFDGTANTSLDFTILGSEVLGVPRNWVANKEAIILAFSGTPTALANVLVTLCVRNRLK